MSIPKKICFICQNPKRNRKFVPNRSFDPRVLNIRPRVCLQRSSFDPCFMLEDTSKATTISTGARLSSLESSAALIVATTCVDFKGESIPIFVCFGVTIRESGSGGSFCIMTKSSSSIATKSSEAFMLFVIV